MKAFARQRRNESCVGDVRAKLKEQGERPVSRILRFNRGGTCYSDAGAAPPEAAISLGFKIPERTFGGRKSVINTE